MKRVFAAIVGMGLVLHGTRAGAGEMGSFGYSFNAFGTFAVVHSNNDQADFVTNFRQPAGAGFTHAWSVTPDSKVGAQVSATFMERISAVVQLVSQYQADGSYRPKVEWANVKYQITPDLNVRAGRIALPGFMYSDTVNVGYALPYVRLPLEVFLQLPIASSDGVDGSYRFHIGGATTTVQAFAGGFDSDIPQGYYNARKLRGVVVTLEDAGLTLHTSYQSLHYDFAQGGIVYNKDDTVSLLSLGAGYDPGRWYVLGEWFRSPDRGLGMFYGGYAFAGWRVDAVTAYVGYARAYNNRSGYLDIAPFMEQRTNSVGVRWDFARHFDAKLQWDRLVLHGGLDTPFVNQQPGFNTRGTVNILSLAVDFSW